MFIFPQNLSHSGHHSNKQEDILQVLSQRLSYFLMAGEHSNKEIMEEIERQISDLKQKVTHCHYLQYYNCLQGCFQIVNRPNFGFWQNAVEGDKKTRKDND